jgi:hypothetical protein
MTDKPVAISMLLPTRGRTHSLKTALLTLAELADDPGQIEMLLAFDDDDSVSYQWFADNIAPQLDALGVRYTAMGFERLGYIRLNEYLNVLAQSAQGDWLFFWGDDAVMKSQGWDSRILEQAGRFRVLRMPTHNGHPYAIFPIVPRQWFEMFGYLSPHQLTDTWCSYIGYMLDIMQDIDVDVLHDRADLTGNNNDETFQNRPMLEGNPHDPRDFYHANWNQRRMQDADRLAAMLRDQGEDVTWWDRCKSGQQDPFAKMAALRRGESLRLGR